MHAKDFTRKSIVGGVIAVAALAAGAAFADTSSPVVSGAPVVVAQATAPATTTVRTTIVTCPAYQARACAAAAQGPEALRRYLWRTRMIWNFQFSEFVPA